MSVGVVVPNNLWILELHCLPVDAPFYLIGNSLLGAIRCHPHCCVIWLLHSMNMKVVAINYAINDTNIAYLLPNKVLLHRLSVNII